MPETLDSHLLPTVRLLDALNCGALLLHRDGQIKYVNARLGEMAGRPSTELVGRDITSLYSSEEDRDAVATRLSKFDEPYEGEFTMPGANGEVVPIIVSGRPLGSSPPESDYRLVTVMDISGQKRAETDAQEEFQVISRLSDTVIAQALELKRGNARLEEKVRERTCELHEANMEAIYMLAVASEAKDLDTGAHVLRIQHYVKLLSTELGLPQHVAEEYGYSAILHDVGKMQVPDSILKKPGPLSGAERERMQLHCIAGERILSRKPFFEIARQIARSHHENWNGTGYPDRLAGEAIPLAARIVHLADIFDALTSERVYKAPWPPQQAAEEIIAERGAFFDPNVVSAFESLRSAGRFTLPSAPRDE